MNYNTIKEGNIHIIKSPRKVECSEEERRTYGVQYKNDYTVNDGKRAIIAKERITRDSDKTIYTVFLFSNTGVLENNESFCKFDTAYNAAIKFVS